MRDSSGVKKKYFMLFGGVFVFLLAGCAVKSGKEDFREYQDVVLTDEVTTDGEETNGVGMNEPTLDKTEKDDKTKKNKLETDATWRNTPLITVEHPKEENLADWMQRNASGCMVQICVGNVMGSGVLWQVVDDKLYIATARHVVENSNEPIEVHFVDGEIASVTEYRLCANTDLAFLCVDIRDFSEERIQEYCLVNTDKESFDALQGGEGVILMASATGVAQDAYEGSLVDTWVYMEDFEQYMMYIQVYAYEGMSGGAVFDQKGHFIGIFCGASSDMDGAAVPLGVIRTEFAESLDAGF